MTPVRHVTGIVAPLARADIDTDAIIPQQWLVTTERDGLGIGLFSNWRYLPASLDPDPAFVLNEDRYRDARIIVAGANYGCGSSREHAVWAHLDYGIQAIIASSFGPIFHDNALKNGLLTLVMDEILVAELMTWAMSAEHNEMGIDVEAGMISLQDGRIYPFTMDEQRRQALLSGEDDIAATLRLSDAIDRFQDEDRCRSPWVWRAVT